MTKNNVLEKRGSMQIKLMAVYRRFIGGLSAE